MTKPRNSKLGVVLVDVPWSRDSHRTLLSVAFEVCNERMMRAPLSIVRAPDRWVVVDSLTHDPGLAAIDAMYSLGGKPALETLCRVRLQELIDAGPERGWQRSVPDVTPRD